VGPRAGPDAVVMRKIPSPCRESNPRYLTKIEKMISMWNSFLSLRIEFNGLLF
jgi:hypothetical protein